MEFVRNLNAKFLAQRNLVNSKDRVAKTPSKIKNVISLRAISSKNKSTGLIPRNSTKKTHQPHNKTIEFSLIRDLKKSKTTRIARRKL